MGEGIFDNPDKKEGVEIKLSLEQRIAQIQDLQTIHDLLQHSDMRSMSQDTFNQLKERAHSIIEGYKEALINDPSNLRNFLSDVRAIQYDTLLDASDIDAAINALNQAANNTYHPTV
jgi:hypothetical protein